MNDIVIKATRIDKTEQKKRSFSENNFKMEEMLH